MAVLTVTGGLAECAEAATGTRPTTELAVGRTGTPRQAFATKRLPHTAKEGGIYDNSYSRDYHNSDEKILVVIQVYLSGNIVPHDGLLFYRCCGSTIE
jgi:hypothetical protein